MNPECNRRQFLSAAVSIAAASRAIALNLSIDSAQKGDAASLRAVFLDPPPSARPMTRWWWFGGAITNEEITRELTFMRDAGLGGVELQPVYPLSVDDPQHGILNTPYLSDRWFDLLRHTATETERLGLRFDFTLGSGWPYGGPMIPVELATRRLRVLRQEVEGPGRCSFDFLSGEMIDGDNVACIVAAPVSSSGGLDLSLSKVIARGDAAAHVAFSPSGWDARAGRWTLMLFIDSPTLMQVKRPTIGMEGYVLDHFDQKAVSLFLHAVGDRTLAELKTVSANPIHSVFCDSLEVYGADWTSAMLTEFERRRGYDLALYLPALWQDAGPLTPHVRYDYHLTLSDLILDNFFRPLVSWADVHEVTARIQAHGAMGDVMRGYGLAQIPEGENYGRSDSYSVNLKHRRIATSAGHVYGRPVISSETFTWLRERMFLVTLEMMKGATDAAFLEGINQIVNHGYPSSPPGVGQPGWTFYAPTVVNHNNTWWRHYGNLVRYTTRTAALLREGRAVNPIAVYLTLPDVYAKFGCGSLNIDEALENHLRLELFNELRYSGYDFDVINDHALTDIAKVSNGVLLAGTAEYHAVIVPPCRLIPPESMDRIAEFARSGGNVIFLERLPEMAPGLAEQQARTMRVKTSLASMGEVVVVPDHASLIKHLDEVLGPDFAIMGDGQLQARREIGFVHRCLEHDDFYFLSNISNSDRQLRVGFACGHKTPELWNAETGEIHPILAYEHSSNGPANTTSFDLHLEPFQSMFVVFTAGANPPSRREAKHVDVSDMPEPVPVHGPWKLHLGNASIELANLQSWTELREGEHYSGWGTYETVFEMHNLGEAITWVIDLGTVHETAAVDLNGVSLGAAWKGLRRLPTRGALKQGRNELRIAVANLWIQKIASEPPPDMRLVIETYGKRWGEPPFSGAPELPPSGLLGPVRLIATKVVTANIT